MTALSALCLVAAAGLAVGAVALGTAGRAGASQALAAVLGVNAALLVRAGLAGTAGWTGATGVSVVASSMFALTPPLVALAAVRARSGGPVRAGDALSLGPFAVALTALVTGAIVTGGWPGGVIELMYLDALNLTFVASVGVAVWAGRALPRAARWAGAAVLAVFAAHWACSQTAWLLGLMGSPRAATAEAASVVLLLAFGIGAAGWGLRRLPGALLAAQPPDRRLPPESAEAGGPGGAAPASAREAPGVTAEDAALATRVLALLDGERVWTDPELTVETLAARLHQPARDVSRVLNGPVGGGFHGAVGARRVAEARRLLAAEPDTTVLEVIYRAGFNSKSSFHRAFKRHAGMTPTAYRRARADAVSSGDGAEVTARTETPQPLGVPVPVPERPDAETG